MTFNQEWLENPNAIRGILVEATISILGIETTLYLSNIGYITGDANTSYYPILSNSVSFSESISIDGSTTMSFGDLEVYNPKGELDDWLSSSYVWVNRPIKVYVGDPTWVCTSITEIHNTFGLIFNGIIADIDSKAVDTLNIKVRDKLERLNTPITEHILGVYGTWASGQTNKETILPLIFGEVHNIQPLLINPALLEYSINDGSTERIIELRDNGVPIYNTIINSGAIINTTTGKFTLTKPLVGTLTASVQGIKSSVNLDTGAVLSTYNNNIANLIVLIVTQYGKSSTKLSTQDLDLNNLKSFSIANTQSVGTIVSDRTNVLAVCQDLASSVGAQIFMNSKGQLQLLRIGVPTTTPIVTITTSDIVFHSLSISARHEVTSSTKIGYCKNYTIQDSLITLIPLDAKDMFKTEWYSKTVTDSSVNNSYLLSTEAVQKDTSLLVGTEALSEAVRLNNFFKVPKTTFKFTGIAKLLSLELGQAVTLVHPRFGLSEGKTGQVISLTPNWSTSTIDIEVLV